MPTTAETKRAAALGHLESATTELTKAAADLDAAGARLAAHFTTDALRQIRNAVAAGDS